MQENFFELRQFFFSSCDSCDILQEKCWVPGRCSSAVCWPTVWRREWATIKLWDMDMGEDEREICDEFSFLFTNRWWWKVGWKHWKSWIRSSWWEDSTWHSFNIVNVIGFQQSPSSPALKIALCLYYIIDPGCSCNFSRWHYREGPAHLPKNVTIGAELVGGFMWWWVLWHMWHEPEHVFVSITVVCFCCKWTYQFISSLCRAASGHIQTPTHGLTKSSEFHPTLLMMSRALVSCV